MFKKIKTVKKSAVALLGSLVAGSASAALDTVALTAEADAFKADAVSVSAIIGVTFMAAAFAFVIWKWIRGAIFS